MMSGFGTHDWVIRAFEKGAADFVTKPFSFIQVNRVINQIFDSKLKSFSEYSSPIARLLRESYLGILKIIINLMEAKSPYTKEHCLRVARYATRIAEKLKLPEGTIEVINYAAELHDIGKIRVPDIILSKAAKLDEAEWVEMKLHPLVGSMLLEQLKFFRAEEPLIRHHHERYDGTGYPGGLSKDDIPLGARIITLADAYDAMTSHRPYRTAFDGQTAKKAIRDNAGNQFDPKLADIFLNIV